MVFSFIHSSKHATTARYSAPVVMTTRHMQHYGDLNFLEESFDNHLRWFEFLKQYFDDGMREKKYDDDLKGYVKEHSL